MKLQEQLEYLQELSQNGMRDEPCFITAYEHYCSSIEKASKEERDIAISFLRKTNPEHLNIEDMIEELKIKSLLSA